MIEIKRIFILKKKGNFMSRNELTIFDVLKNELEKRNNPTDLKSAIIGKVVQLDPIIVSISDGNVLLHENKHLKVSEWFKFRCDIDETKPFTNSVSIAVDKAKTPTCGGEGCNIGSIVSNLATALQNVSNALYTLKCNLALGDLVTVTSLEEDGKYVLLDKVIYNA